LYGDLLVDGLGGVYGVVGMVVVWRGGFCCCVVIVGYGRCDGGNIDGRVALIFASY
jgi:hypothetical protein